MYLTLLPFFWIVTAAKQPPPIFCLMRRERDSNPRNIAVQRFSRPPHSTTLPSFQVGCAPRLPHNAHCRIYNRRGLPLFCATKVTQFFTFAKFRPPRSGYLIILWMLLALWMESTRPSMSSLSICLRSTCNWWMCSLSTSSTLYLFLIKITHLSKKSNRNKIYFDVKIYKKSA